MLKSVLIWISTFGHTCDIFFLEVYFLICKIHILTYSIIVNSSDSIMSLKRKPSLYIPNCSIMLIVLYYSNFNQSTISTPFLPWLWTKDSSEKYNSICNLFSFIVNSVISISGLELYLFCWFIIQVFCFPLNLQHTIMSNIRLHFIF